VLFPMPDARRAVEPGVQPACLRLACRRVGDGWVLSRGVSRGLLDYVGRAALEKKEGLGKRM